MLLARLIPRPASIPTLLKMSINNGQKAKITAASIAATFKQDLVENIVPSVSKQIARKPKLLGILANADEPSRLYAESTKKACEEIGVEFVFKTVGSNKAEEKAQPSDVEQAVLEANMDDTVDGIMIYYPIFSQAEDSYLQQTVSPIKDVEGLHFFFRFNLYHNIRYISPQSLLSGSSPALSSSPTLAAEEEESSGKVKAILPCTPLALVKVMESIGVYNQVLPYGQRAFGKTICVINRSEVVGRPLAALLANDGARVFSIDVTGIVEYTRRAPSSQDSTMPAWHPRHITKQSSLSLKECLGLSDVVISGVPSEKYKIETSDLKDGVIAVNFSSAKNFQPDIRDKASIYLPSIGKITVAILQRNLLRLVVYRNRLQDDKQN